MGNFILKNWRSLLVIFVMTCMIAQPAFAAGDLPFASTMETLEEGISGPFLLSASIIMIVVTCLMLAFGEWGDGFKKIITIVLWLSVAFAAATFIKTVFGK